MTRRLLLLPLLLSAQLALADDNPQANVYTFRPSPIAGDLLGVGTTATGANGPSGVLGATWNEKPLRVTDQASGAEARIVARQIALELGGAWQLADRVSLGLMVPLFASSQGGALPAELNLTPVSGASLGDIRLVARGVLVRAGDFGLGIREDVTLPTASHRDFTGDLGVTSTSLLIADWAHRDFRVALNLGARVRKSVAVLATDVGNDWLASLGGIAPIVPALVDVIGTVDARTAVAGTFLGAQTTTCDALGGVRAHLGEWAVTAAAGGGVASGWGSPVFRATLLLAYAPAAHSEQPAAAPPPPADRDLDGVLDGDDKCPAVAGPASNGGCPSDRDGDGVPDASDKCPELAGTVERHGCPEQRVVITKEKIAITEKIFFETGVERIQKQSLSLLDEIAALLKKHPEIKKVRIEGHTDNAGDPAVNLRLSAARALAVRKYLVSKGIIEARLTSAGLGDQRPLGDNGTEEGRAQNRRVEFLILGVER